MPSGVPVRRADTTQKWKASLGQMCCFSPSSRQAKSSSSASAPVACGFWTACQAEHRRPAKYCASGPSKRLSRMPTALELAFSADSATKYAPTALSSSAFAVAAPAAPSAISTPRVSLRQGPSLTTDCNFSRRSRKDSRVSERPFNVSMSKTTTVGVAIHGSRLPGSSSAPAWPELGFASASPWTPSSACPWTLPSSLAVLPCFAFLLFIGGFISITSRTQSSTPWRRPRSTEPTSSARSASSSPSAAKTRAGPAAQATWTCALSPSSNHSARNAPLPRRSKASARLAGASARMGSTWVP
mmetsp:Transcript_21583/g.67369  ORF Transcript_21583/g.67369 Transcript_21583/m.67369 type:complete len:300 (-) Transcript_21583:1169-2068(-)